MLARGLQRATADSRRKTTTAVAQGVIDSLCASMSSRFHRIHANHILAEAAALDPRFKRMAFPDGRTADEMFQRLSTAAARISSGKPIQQQPAVEGLEGAGSGAGSIVWSYFHEEVRVATISQIFFLYLISQSKTSNSCKSLHLICTYCTYCTYANLLLSLLIKC